MTVLVFGKTGQVATELGLMDGIVCLGRDDADLSDPTSCAAAIRQANPRAVINAAAYTAVDRAETEEDLAVVINADAPAAMAQACSDLGIPFVTISTDYVFDGTGDAPWRPEDQTGPLGAYGRSKLRGEQAVAATGGAWAVVRTSWVISAHGSNFVKTMLRLGRERDELRIVDDQIGAPTPARDIAATCVEVVRKLTTNQTLSGVYHLSGAPAASWKDLAVETFERADIRCRVVGISSSAYPTPAARPLNSRLDCASLEAVFGITPPDWRQGLHEILSDLGELA